MELYKDVRSVCAPTNNTSIIQVRSQTVNTVGAACAYIHAHTHMYVYNGLLYIYCVYIYVLCLCKRKKRLCQDHKINTVHDTLYNTAQNVLHIRFLVSSPMAQQPAVGQGLLIIGASQSHSDTPNSVGLLWTSDQPDAETSTWQHTALTRETSVPPAGFELTIPASERPLRSAFHACRCFKISCFQPWQLNRGYKRMR
jgi:Ca2+/Na+ antiporter